MNEQEELAEGISFEVFGSCPRPTADGLWLRHQAEYAAIYGMLWGVVRSPTSATYVTMLAVQERPADSSDQPTPVLVVRGWAMDRGVAEREMPVNTLQLAYQGMVLAKGYTPPERVEPIWAEVPRWDAVEADKVVQELVDARCRLPPEEVEAGNAGWALGWTVHDVPDLPPGMAGRVWPSTWGGLELTTTDHLRVVYVWEEDTYRAPEVVLELLDRGHILLQNAPLEARAHVLFGAPAEYEPRMAREMEVRHRTYRSAAEQYRIERARSEATVLAQALDALGMHEEAADVRSRMPKLGVEDV